MSLQGLQELFNGYSKDSKKSPRGIKENVSFRSLHKSQRTLLMALLIYKTFPLGTLLNHQGFQEVIKGPPKITNDYLAVLMEESGTTFTKLFETHHFN